MPPKQIESDKLIKRLAGGGGMLLLGGSVAAFLSPDAFGRAYFVAYFYWLNIALGSLFILLFHELCGGAWGEYIRDFLKAAAGTLAFLALLFFPLWFGLGTLFPWAEEVGGIEFRGHQSAWLQPGWHVLRSVLCLVVWIAVAATMHVFSPRRYDGGLRTQASVGLILMVLVTTLFAVDWILALSMAGSSTMIGFVLISGQLAGAVASSIVYVAVRRALGTAFTEHDRDCLNDLGNLLLAAVSFYGYVLYMEYLIVWEGNLPLEIEWYETRSEPLGVTVALVLVATHIVIPIGCLLFRRVKRSVNALAGVAGSVLVGRLLQVYWDLMPVIRGTHSVLVMGLDILFLIAMGALWIAFFLFLLQRTSKPGRGPTHPLSVSRPS